MMSNTDSLDSTSSNNVDRYLQLTYTNLLLKYSTYSEDPNIIDIRDNSTTVDQKLTYKVVDTPVDPNLVNISAIAATNQNDKVNQTQVDIDNLRKFIGTNAIFKNLVFKVNVSRLLEQVNNFI